MEKFRGTEGPWVANGGQVCSQDYEINGVVYSDHVCDCEVINGESPNANLIAAAPELLEALQELTFLYEHDEGCRNLIEYNRAKSAIAKALGK